LKIGIIDVDLLERDKHRFPNLACMKIAGYYKELGYNVELLMNYDELNEYDKVFISKVFTDTPINEEILKLNNVKYGGTGFFYDKAEPLPYEIEHHMPYYDLYKKWVDEQISNGKKKSEFDFYLNYSIGYMTRGCFRQCPFCVNKNYKQSLKHSPVKEFLDITRRKICLLDDNVLACSKWREIFEELNSTNKSFIFKQGMDERLLTKEKCEVILKSNHVNDYLFAFDNIEDKDIIIEKLKLWNSCGGVKAHSNRFYVFCGFDRQDKYDDDFWIQDIIDTFERIKILMEYGCIPYIMRYKDYINSPYKGTYISLAQWCNQPAIFKKKSYREFCMARQEYRKTSGLCSNMRYLIELKEVYPPIEEYYDIKYKDLKGEM